IPQSSEGTQFFTQAITPISTVNILEVSYCINADAAASGVVAYALFQDAVANAVSATMLYNVGAAQETIASRFRKIAGTTSSTTFKLRAGNNAGSTITINGSAAARQMGGVASSSLSVREIMT